MESKRLVISGFGERSVDPMEEFRSWCVGVTLGLAGKADDGLENHKIGEYVREVIRKRRVFVELVDKADEEAAIGGEKNGV